MGSSRFLTCWAIAGLGLLGELDGSGILSGSPVGRNLELTEGGSAGIDGLMVGVDDGLALLHVDLVAASFMYCRASSAGRTLASAKKADWSTVLVRLPMPTLAARSIASIR